MSTFLIAPVLLLSVLAFPAAAQAADKVVDDCVADGAVDGHYSNSALRKALKAIQADSSEYSDCRGAIQAALKPATKKKKSGGSSSAGAAGAGTGGSASDGGGGGTDPDLNGDGTVTPSERNAAKDKDLALQRDNARKGTEAKLGAQRTDPTKVGALDASDTSNGLPTPVLLAIIALALLAVAAGTILIGRRRPEFAQALRRVPIPKRFRKQ